jgi:transposase
MRFIGADLHKKSITFCVVEVVAAKTVVRQRQRLLCSCLDQVEQFLASHTPHQLVVEATIGYEWFADLADKHADRVVLAHSGKLRVIAESTRKTDKIDAYVLAEFLAKDMIPQAWRPTGRVRQHRSLVRRRCKVQSRITSVKNTMRALLTRYNADRADLFSKVGWKQALKTDLLAEERWVLQDLYEELTQHQERLAKLDSRLDEFAAQAPTREAEARAVLATMTQVGKVTIETVLAELGDWRRFGNADQVASYAGLEPGVRESDGRRKELRLTKSGSPLLRWIMIQLAHRLKRKSARWERVFEQLEKRVGNKKATCAVARRLLLVMYAMLRDGQSYRMPATADSRGAAVTV